MNILIIENDEFLLENIRKTFEKTILSNRVKAINSFDSFLNENVIIDSYDIVLIDINLGNPKKTGIDIIKIIRKKNIKIPLVIMSSCDDLSTIDYAFEVGANDYLVKPFRLRELEIRVFKWLKDYFFSIKYFKDNSLVYEGLSYNIKQNNFYFNGKLFELTKQNKYLLSIFLSYSEKFISKNFLIDKIWGDISTYETRNIRVNILRLKKALEIIGIDNWIENVRGEGYILKK